MYRSHPPTIYLVNDSSFGIKYTMREPAGNRWKQHGYVRGGGEERSLSPGRIVKIPYRKMYDITFYYPEYLETYRDILKTHSPGWQEIADLKDKFRILSYEPEFGIAIDITIIFENDRNRDGLTWDIVDGVPVTSPEYYADALRDLVY